MSVHWFRLTDGRAIQYTGDTDWMSGTMYFVLHPHGLHMSGRWVGLGYDDRIMTGFASMGQTQEESESTMSSLIESQGVTPVDE